MTIIERTSIEKDEQANYPKKNLCLVLNGDDLAQHDGGVSVEESNTRETLARLKVVNDQGLDRLENNLGSLVGLEGVGVLQLFAASLLTDLPLNLGDLAGGTSTANETNRGVSGLNLTGNIQSLNLGGEALDGLEGLVLLVDHNITSTGHVDLIETLNVHTNVITALTLLDLLVMHFHGEDLSGAGSGSGVGGEEYDILVSGDNSLFNTSSQHIANTLDLVDSGDRDTHEGVVLARRQLDEAIEGIEESVDLDFGARDGSNLRSLFDKKC